MAKRHKWDIITDKCEKCGITRRVKRSIKGMFVFGGYYTEFLVNEKWTTDCPECK